MSVRVLVGDCRERLRELEAGICHMCVTSPPYWGLRSYLDADDPNKALELGSEPTPDLYVAHLVEVFREVRRVMRDDAILVLNLGDSYASSGARSNNNGEGASTMGWPGQKHETLNKAAKMKLPAMQHGLKPKDLCGIPWRVAFALQADGWWLRSAMPWVKKNPMPESVTDRPMTAHEYVFLLAKSKKYYYDNEAVKTLSTEQSIARMRRGNSDSHKNSNGAPGQTPHTMGQPRDADPDRAVTPTRNRRTSDTFYESLDLRIQQQREHLAHLEHVRDNGGMLLGETGDAVALMVNTKGYSGAHFAVFPKALVRPCIKAGTSERGVCPECGAGWRRVVEKGASDWAGRKAAGATGGTLEQGQNTTHGNGTNHTLGRRESTTTGWAPGCECKFYKLKDGLDESTTAMILGRLARTTSGS